jgi:hypothetical protein
MLMQELRTKNSDWMAELMSGDTHAHMAVDPMKVATVPWEEKMKPLTWEEIQVCWQRLHHDRRERANDLNELAAILLSMCDRGYIVYDGIHGGAVHKIFPAAASQLFFLKDSPSDVDFMLHTWDKQLEKFAPVVLEAVWNMRQSRRP